MARSTTPIGCFTRDWNRDTNVFVDEYVHAALHADPSLERLLERKLEQHRKRLPRILGRGQMRHTIAWKSRDGVECVITTTCTSQFSLVTMVHLQETSR